MGVLLFMCIRWISKPKIHKVKSKMPTGHLSKDYKISPSDNTSTTRVDIMENKALENNYLLDLQTQSGRIPDLTSDITYRRVATLVTITSCLTVLVTVGLNTGFTHVVVQGETDNLHDRLEKLYLLDKIDRLEHTTTSTPDVAAPTAAATTPATATPCPDLTCPDLTCPDLTCPETSATAPAPAVDHGPNPCYDKKPIHSNAAGDDNYFKNVQCLVDGVSQALEQSGTNVTKGYKGEVDTTGRDPITTTYKEAGLCPVNVHWHLGTEHLSVGQFDEHGKGPGEAGSNRKMLAADAHDVRKGYQCLHYDAADAKFTKEYDWKSCKDMHVGETYEVHWPHSAAGECVPSGTVTPWQYQSPFYDGVFCNGGIISLDPLNTFFKIGVQAQVFTIVNDEAYYVPDLFRGMLVDAGKHQGEDMAKYTGSTTGTTRSNEVCSRYTPITWQVDRKCHMISASSFDKMCADMLMQADDMSSDIHPHGSRELVADEFAADNHQK